MKKEIILVLMFLLGMVSTSFSQCTPQPIPYYQSFNNWPLNCWSLAGASGSFTGNSFGYAELYNYFSGSATMITEKIVLGSRAYVEFNWQHGEDTVNNPYEFIKLSMKRVSDVGYTEIWKLEGNDFTAFTQNNSFIYPYFVNQVIVLDSSYIGDTVRFRFEVYKGSYTDQIYIDDFKVQPFCGSVLQAPFVENFDGPTWVADDTNFYAAYSSLDSCWINTPHRKTGVYSWRVRHDSTSSVGTGPLTDYSTTGSYVYAEGTGGSSNKFATLYSPYIDVSTLKQPEISYYVHSFGNNIGKLYVYAWQNNQWVLGDTLFGQKQTSSSDAWLKRTFYIDSTGITRLMFKADKKTAGGFAADLALDEIAVNEGPQCQRPKQVTLRNVSDVWATIEWDATNASKYYIEYGAKGFLPGNGTLDSATANQFTIWGLQSFTEYDVYVWGDCAAQGISPQRKIEFKTTYCPLNTLNYLEDFNQFVGTNLACWELPSALVKSQTPQNGTPRMQIETDHYYSIGSRINIKSPVVRLNKPSQLRFKWDHDPIFNKYDDHLTILVGVYGTNVWDTIFFKDSTDFDCNCSGNSTAVPFMVEDTASIPLSYVGKTVQFRLVAYVGGDRDTYIDDFIVESSSPNNCIKPTDIKISNIKHDGALVEFIGANTGVARQVVYTLDKSVVLGTIATSTANTLQLSGLSPNTTYYVKYREICSAGDTLSWSSQFVEFKTYCLPVAVPYLENFAIWPEQCFSFQQESASNLKWTHYNGNAAKLNMANTPRAKAWLVTGLVDLNTDAVLSYARSSHAHPYPDSLLILCKAYHQEKWDTLQIKTQSTLVTNDGGGRNNPGSYEYDTIALWSKYVHDTVQFAFVGVSAKGSDLFIDNIKIACSPQNPKINVSTSLTTTLTDAVVTFNAGKTIYGSTFQWDFGNGQTANGVVASKSFTANGFYLADLTVYSSCGSMSDTTFGFYVNGIGLEEATNQQQVLVYPNPTKGKFNVDIGSQNGNLVRLTLLNAVGQIVLNQEIHIDSENFIYEIDLSNNPQGMYMLQIQMPNERVISKKVIRY